MRHLRTSTTMRPDDEEEVRRVLRLHAHKLAAHRPKKSRQPSEPERCVFLIRSLSLKSPIPLHADFIKHTREEAAECLNGNVRTVQWLMMRQIVDYDPSRQMLAGILFEDTGDVLADVFATSAVSGGSKRGPVRKVL